MSRADEKHGFISANSPITENSQEADIEFDEVGSSASGCGCFRLCCFGWNQNKYNLLHQNGTTEKREISWVAEKFKEVKEFSELVAGPKWKNFVRKIGKYCSPKRSRPSQGTYSPQSYALNFDDGDEEDNDFFVNFSSRFSAPPPTRPSDQQRRESS